MLLNEGLLKSSRPVKDPHPTGTHKTQTALRQKMESCSGGGMVNEYRQEERQAKEEDEQNRKKRNCDWWWLIDSKQSPPSPAEISATSLAKINLKNSEIFLKKVVFFHKMVCLLWCLILWPLFIMNFIPPHSCKYNWGTPLLVSLLHTPMSINPFIWY